MKKIILLFLAMSAFLWAKTPMQLVQEGACYWPSKKTDKTTGEVIVTKGCPRYYTEKCNDCTVEFTTKKIKEDDDVFEILIVDWNIVKSTEDGKNKFRGTTKFVVDSKDGEEGLFPYETKVNCKGATCAELEQTITSSITQLAEICGIYDFSGMAGIWDRSFSIDKEAVLYYVNHDVTEETVKKFMLRSLAGGEENVSLGAVDPVYFNVMMNVSQMECPSLK